jgi:hypothetical protein
MLQDETMLSASPGEIRRGATRVRVVSLDGRDKSTISA